MAATSTVQYLDMSKFNYERSFTGLSPYTSGPQSVSLRSIVQSCRLAVESLQHTGLLATINSKGMDVDSVGFAMTNPSLSFEQVRELWNSPYELIYMVGGYGPNRDQYVANGVRKLRPAARRGKPTLELNMFEPDSFIDKVESVDSDGRFLWGDFPWGGAVWIPLSNGKGFWIAVSAFKQDEDQLASYLYGGAIATELERGIALELAA
jgi:hypothetical protein